MTRVPQEKSASKETIRREFMVTASYFISKTMIPICQSSSALKFMRSR